MLKYKIQLHNPSTELVEVQCEHIYFSEDLTYISGITSTRYGLTNNQPIYISVNDSSDMNEYNISITNVKRQGYVMFDQKYHVFDDDGNRGIVFADGKKYVAKEDEENVIIDSYMIGDTSAIDLSDDIVTIQTKYYIEDNKVSISGIIYVVDSEYETEVTLKNGTKLPIYDNDVEKEVIHFIIRKNLDYLLDVEHMSCAKEFKYILSSTTESEVVSNKKIYLQLEYKDGEQFYTFQDVVLENTKIVEVYIDKVILEKTSTDQEGNKVTTQLTYALYNEWRNTSYGQHAHIYLNHQHNITNGQVIKVTPIEPSEYWVAIDNEIDDTISVTINGKTYTSSVSANTEDYVIYRPTLDSDPKELLINYTTPNWKGKAITTEDKLFGFVNLDDTPLLLQDIDLTNKVAHRKVEYLDTIDKKPIVMDKLNIKTYNFIIIENVKYQIYERTIVKFDDNGNEIEVIEKGIFYKDEVPIRLLIEHVMGNNQLRCQIINSIDKNSGILYQLSINISNFIFELENPLFSEQMIDNLPSSDKGYVYETYKIYKPTNYIVVPMYFNNTAANDMHRGYIYENQFFNVESDKSINRIIDMEKNIYLPAYNNNDTFELIDEIVIDLHFRSRDLTTWKINEDCIGQADGIKCNWNIFDYYDIDNRIIDRLKPKMDMGNFPYYQPADLLYFIGFTDDDVFYQKQKIGKSFLRLSFYDTNNPMKQNLLHTATIFMDEGKLYKTYIDNTNNKGQYISVDDIDQISQRVFNSSISVRYDTYNNENEENIYQKNVDCIQDKRLAASFSIKNMYESNESSEGFYLYLFKEFNEGLRERTIYMTVEFNHAGYGKTVKFMQPHQNGQMLDLSNNDVRDEFLKGYPLNKIYDYLYIPIKIKYDFDAKKYFYYLPSWLCMNEDKNVMRLNLYELKIADQTIKQ